jgi:hypothetical protein
MNLIKAAELLKGAPDTELDKYLQQPTGEFPEYLVASEKLRREEMRQKFANQGQPSKTSIIEQLLQKDNQQMRQKMQPQQPQQPPEAMGLGSVPPPEGMQLSPAPMMEAAQQQPQQFYDGGVVALAGGGDPRDYQLSQWLGIEPTAAGRMSQEEMNSARSREMAAREIFGDSRMNGQMGSPDMYGAGTNIGQVGLHGQYTPFTNQAMGQANISQPMAGGIANIGATGTLNPTGGRISSLNASYGNPDVNVSGSFNPKAQRFTGRVGHDGYGVSADYGKGLERVGADYSDGQTMGGINYMPGQGSVQGQVLHRLSPNSQVSVGGQYGKHKDINARYIQQFLNGEIDVGGGYGDRGAYGNVNFKRSFAQGGLAGLSSEIHDYLEGYAAGGEVKHFKAGDAVADPFALPSWATEQQAVPEAMTQQQAVDFAKQQLGESAVEGYEPLIQARQKKIEENQKNYLPNFLINAGLGMATSAKLNPLQAAAEGALKGFEYHQKAKAADEEAQRQLEDSRFKFKAAQRAEKAGLLGLSNQLFNSSQDAHISGVNANRQSVALSLNAASARATAEHQREMAGYSRQQVANQAAQIREARKDRELAREQATDVRLQNLYEKAWEKISDVQKAIQSNIAKGEVPPYYDAEVAKMATMNDLQKQVAMQRLQQRMETDYGVTPDIRAYANRLFPTK